MLHRFGNVTIELKCEGIGAPNGDVSEADVAAAMAQKPALNSAIPGEWRASLVNFTGEIVLKREAPASKYSAGGAAVSGSLPSWLSMVEVTEHDQTPSTTTGAGKRAAVSSLSSVGTASIKKSRVLEASAAPVITPIKTEVATHCLERSGHVAWASDARYWLHGGGGESAIYGDLVSFQFQVDGNDVARVCVSRPCCAAFPIRDHTACLIENKLCVLWGGLTTADRCEDGLSQDVICHDTEFSVSYPQATQGKAPSGRKHHTSCALLRTKMIVFGGERHKKFCVSNIHVLDTERWQWSQPKTEGNPPRARSKHSCCAISSNRCIVFGGQDGSCAFNDVHLLVANTHGHGQSISWNWEQPFIVGEVKPRPRSGHSAIIVGQGRFLLVYGGCDEFCGTVPEHHADAWLLDLEAFSWKAVPMEQFTSEHLELDTSSIVEDGVPDVSVSERQTGMAGVTGAAMSLLPDGTIVLFGGNAVNGKLSRRVIRVREQDLYDCV